MSLFDGGETEAAAFRAALRATTHDIGSFDLVGHGIPDEVTTRASPRPPVLRAPLENKHCDDGALHELAQLVEMTILHGLS